MSDLESQLEARYGQIREVRHYNRFLVGVRSVVLLVPAIPLMWLGVLIVPFPPEQRLPSYLGILLLHTIAGGVNLWRGVVAVRPQWRETFTFGVASLGHRQTRLVMASLVWRDMFSSYSRPQR